MSSEGAKPSGAICDDLSFPGIARDLALDGAGLALGHLVLVLAMLLR